MKKTLGLLLTFAAALLLVGCGNKVGKNGEEIDFSDTFKEKSNITVWIDDEDGTYMEEVIKEFNKIYPDIHVSHYHKGSVDSREHLKTFGPSGNGADVFQFPHDHLSAAILEDLVLPLPGATKELIGERSHELGVDIATLFYNEDKGTFDPNDTNAVESLFAVPMSIEAVGLYYNKDILNSLGHDVATTYEEIIEQGLAWNSKVPIGKETGTNAVDGNYYLGTTSHWADSYFIQHIYSAFGFTPFGDDLNDATEVGFAKLDKALEWMTGDFRKITTGSGETGSVSGGQKFEEGLIPYVIGGPWNIEAFKAKDINFGMTQLPSINGKDTKPYAGAMMAAVYKYSKNQADAIKFVEFLNSDVAMDLQFEYKGKLPALKTELLSDEVKEDDLLMVMSKQLEIAVPMPTIPEVQYFWGPGETMVQQVWNASKDIKQALAEAEASYKTLAGLGEN